MFGKLRSKKLLMSGALIGSLFGLGSSVDANTRHFTYTYESAVLAPGAREFELWNTYRTGRHEFYTQFDHRAEFEFGLTKKLQTSLYLNWQTISQIDHTTTPESIATASEFKGISSEWKYQMTDPVADKIGSALYGEVSLGTDEMELESKLILDKRLGRNLFAYNLVLAGAWEREPVEWEYEETELENNLGWTHFFKENFGAGLELRNHTEFTSENHPEHSSLFLGPVVSYSADSWWLAFTSMWQLPAIKRSVSDPNSALVLDEHERFNARLLLGFHF